MDVRSSFSIQKGEIGRFASFQSCVADSGENSLNRNPKPLLRYKLTLADYYWPNCRKDVLFERDRDYAASAYDEIPKMTRNA